MTLHASMLPLASPVLAEQANRFICVQTLLRKAGDIRKDHSTLPAQAGALVEWLEPRIQEAMEQLRSEKWWNGPATAEDADALISAIDQAGRALAEPTVPQILALSSVDSLVSMRQYFMSLSAEKVPAEGDVEDHLRMIAGHLNVAEIPIDDLLWKKGEPRPQVADGRIVASTDPALPETLREAAAGVSHILLAPLQASTSPVPGGEVACKIASNDPHHLHRMGKLCALVDTMQLYGMHLRTTDERAAVAQVFASVVMQQQHLMMTLENLGFRLDMAKPTPVPDDCLPLNAFSLGSHEVFLSEMRQIQAAKDRAGLVRFAMDAYARLKAEITSLIAEDSMIPDVEGGWIPSRRDLRDKHGLRAHIFAFAQPTNGGEPEPIIYRIPAGTRISELSGAPSVH